MVTLKYDSFGRRIQKQGGNGTTSYIYDGLNLLEELGVNGNEVARYSEDGKIDEILTSTREGVASFVEQDGLYSITSLSNGIGTISDTYTYDSFGGLSASAGDTMNPLHYAGRDFDSESGLYYYRARYFDPRTGRFLSEDPIRFKAGVDFYPYVLNDPVRFIDPLGLDGGDAPGPAPAACLLSSVCGPIPPPGAPNTMTFDRLSGTLVLYGPDGQPLIVCIAGNRTDSASNGPWPNGTYPFSRHNDHPADPNGPYGSYGIDIFQVPGRTGMGVHSGRDNRGGPEHPTEGCVRTTDDCMKSITDYQKDHQITSIKIQ